MTTRRRIDILGVQIDDTTMPEAVARVLAWSAQRAGRLVVTPNPEIVMAARRDPEFRAILNAADLAVPDGMGLVWAARLLGRPLRGTTPGVDLVEALAPEAAAHGQRWYLLGGAEGVAAAAGRVLTARHPGLIIAGAMAGDPAPGWDKQAQAAIHAAGPVDLLLVAYGAPKQERWLARNLTGSGAAVGIGVGGAFNFIAGRSRRPPAVIQRAGFGWLFRLATEPWRWRRQLALPRFAALVLAEAIRRQKPKNVKRET